MVDKDTMSNHWKFNPDNIDDKDFDFSESGWEEDVEGLNNMSGALGSFYDPYTEIDMEVIYWDSEYLVLKGDTEDGNLIQTIYGEEFILSVNKWTGEELEGIEIDELPKDAQDIILKEKI